MTASRRRRVLVWGEAVTLSHVVGPAPLARARAPPGYEVFFACDPRYNELLDLPFNLIPVTSAFRSVDIVDVLSSGRPLFDIATIDRYVLEDLRVISEVSPDLLVGDMRQSFAVSGKLASVPFLNIMNAHLSPYGRLDANVVDYPLLRLAPEPITSVLRPILYLIGSAVHALPVNVVRAKYGMPPLGPDARNVFCAGDYVVYPDIPELSPTSNRPPTHAYIGPVLWSPHVEMPEWWDRVPDDKPIVYVSLGSSGRQDLLGTIVAALSRLPVYVMAATAGAARLDSVPDNVFLADFLPGNEAARRARLVVCNGGSMPVQQALAGGAPVLGIVSNPDQLMFARAVRAAGAGEMLREGEVTEVGIRRLAWRLLNFPAYGVVARRLAEVYSGYDAPSRFRAFVEDVVLPQPT